MYHFIACILSFLLSSCTMVGIGHLQPVDVSNLSATEKLRICIYKDSDVSDSRTEQIMAGIKREFVPHGINIEIPWVRYWKRPAFAWKGILEDVASRPLEPPCDRQLALLSRHFGDFLWGIIMPEINGAVETTTMTKGFAVAELGSLNQSLTMRHPWSIAAHEIYHFLGCGHGIYSNSCPAQVANIKLAARNNRELGRDFFLAMTLDGKTFWTRDAVDREFAFDTDKSVGYSSN